MNHLATLARAPRGAIAGSEVALRLTEKTPSRYAVEFAAGTGKPRTVLFRMALPTPQPPLFRLDSLGEDDWIKAPGAGDYALRGLRPGSPQRALFPQIEVPQTEVRGRTPRRDSGG